MKNFKFEILGEIKTKQRPRRGANNHMYTPSSTTYYENLVKTVYQNANGIYFDDFPLKVIITAYFAPSIEVKKCIGSIIPACTNKKDLDNIAKIILDSLNGIAYKDDKQVCNLEIEKRYSESNKEYVAVEIIALEHKTLENAKTKKKIDKTYMEWLALDEKEKLTAAEIQRYEKLEKTHSELFDKTFYLRLVENEIKHYELENFLNKNFKNENGYIQVKGFKHKGDIVFKDWEIDGHFTNFGMKAEVITQEGHAAKEIYQGWQKAVVIRQDYQKAKSIKQNKQKADVIYQDELTKDIFEVE